MFPKKKNHINTGENLTNYGQYNNLKLILPYFSWSLALEKG